MPETSPIAATDSASPAGPDSVVTRASGKSELFEAVARAVKGIRPAIQADQGDVFLKDVDSETGLVSVELAGACISCPSTARTVTQSLERVLKQRVEGVTEVRHVGETPIEADEGTPVSL